MTVSVRPLEGKLDGFSFHPAFGKAPSSRRTANSGANAQLSRFATGTT